MLIRTACPDMSRHYIAISIACAPRADAASTRVQQFSHEDDTPL
jgi:hypothetical protein